MSIIERDVTVPSELAESARRQQAEVESSQRFVVGVNEFTEGSEEVQMDTLKIDASVEKRQRQRMADLRASRDDLDVARALEELERSCRDGKNVVPGILECARADCTLYEIRHAMEKTFGSYKEPVFF